MLKNETLQNSLDENKTLGSSQMYFRHLDVFWSILDQTAVLLLP